MSIVKLSKTKFCNNAQNEVCVLNSIDKINIILAKLGKTGADLEREIGVSASVYSQWNTGRTAPSKRSLVKVAAALNVNVEDLLPDQEETIVDRIRALAREQGTSLTKLEERLGFGNGTIGRWSKHNPSFERLKLVADALGVTTAYLMGEETKKEPATNGDEHSSDDLELLKAFHSADEKTQAAIRILLDSFRESK